MQVAQTILNQLGGGKFIVMTGSKNFLKDGEYALQMTLSKNTARAKYLKIELMPNDTYTMTFRKPMNKNFESEVIVVKSGVYCDQLQSVFTSVTGLYCSLGTMAG